MTCKVIVIAVICMTLLATLVFVACCKVSGRISRMEEEQDGK